MGAVSRAGSRDSRCQSRVLRTLLHGTRLQRHLRRLRRVRLVRWHHDDPRVGADRTVGGRPPALGIRLVPGPADDTHDDHPAWIPGTMAMGLDAFVATLDERGVPRDAY